MPGFKAQEGAPRSIHVDIYLYFIIIIYKIFIQFVKKKNNK